MGPMPVKHHPQPIHSTLETDEFRVVLALISQARQQAVQAVNTALIDLYWQIGGIISRKIASAEWGTGVVDKLAHRIAQEHPGLRGFTRPNLFRMRQFHEAYRDAPTVSPLVRQIPWSHHLLILAQSKHPEEKLFYLQMTAQECWSKRELMRQLKSALFERRMLSPVRATAALSHHHPQALSVFKDSYLVEFLGLPAQHSEADLHAGLLAQLRDFLIELGRDLCFVGTQFPLQVGRQDFAIDLLLFHRGLNSLVAIELKVGRFEPEHLGKLNFYLEALDRDHRKPHENPAIGVLLCASQDDEVVEYALNRSLSPAMIAQYQTQLPDKKLLQRKLQELLSRQD